jgi:hypothetical protein
MNRSRHERQHLPARAEFSVTFIAIGVFVGLFFGFVAELVWHRSALVMLAGGFAGALIGSAVEGARFWRGTRRFHRARKE